MKNWYPALSLLLLVLIAACRADLPSSSAETHAAGAVTSQPLYNHQSRQVVEVTGVVVLPNQDTARITYASATHSLARNGNQRLDWAGGSFLRYHVERRRWPGSSTTMGKGEVPGTDQHGQAWVLLIEPPLMGTGFRFPPSGGAARMCRDDGRCEIGTMYWAD